MRIVVTGSIASYHLMTFPCRFVDRLIDDHLDQVSLSFLADSLAVHRGGAGAAIALGLARLGDTPAVVGAAGPDRFAAILRAGYGLDATVQVEPHLPAAVSDAGTVW